MKTQFRMLACAAATAFALTLTPALAQDKEFQPSVGQMGKDVIWVPTAQGLVDRMLEMAKVTPNDFLIDLGSGDGRTVITAAKRGVKAIGVEYNPDMVALSRKNAEKEGAKLAEFVQGDIFEYDFSKATVLTLFLLPQINLRLRPTILNMKPGTRVVSNSFDMGDWPADEVQEAKSECQTYCRAMLWIVPAKVQGDWTVNGGRISLNQAYQNVSGSMNVNGTQTPISNGKLSGDNFTFEVGGKQFKGKVTEASIEGTLGSDPFSAKRAN
jgi:precorrin-6B methylase 2